MNNHSEKDNQGLINKKRKSNRKVIWFVIIGLCILGIVFGCRYYYSVKAQNEDTEETIVLEEGQQLVYAKIISISGNEMIYALSEEELQEKETPDNNENLVGYKVSEEMQTTMIPVGTEVVTKLGNITTFSRLANGDMIKMILQTDADGTQTIMKIYMVA